MSKNKLTKQQKLRIKQNQDRIDSEILGDLFSGLTGLIIAHYGDLVDVENNLNKVIKCNLRQNLPALAVGDRVLYQLINTLDDNQDNKYDQLGVVTKLLDRTSLLARSNTAKKTIKPVAANIDQIFIVFACEPEPQSILIDQFLITAETNNIKPILIFNKYDLFNKLSSDSEKNLDTIKKIKNINNLLNIYKNIGYQVLNTSVYDKSSINLLSSLLTNKNSIFVGASGVGKSTITQQLMPGIIIKTGEISEKTMQGKHTTSISKLYHLNNQYNSNIIDAPGIREIGVDYLSQAELEKAYPEFKAYYQKCKFRDCIHEKEPNCAYKAAVATGAISLIRWENYKRLRSG